MLCTAPCSSPASRRERRDNRARSAFTYDDASGSTLYEEYFAFGMTSFHSADGSMDVSARRYRYNGKARADGPNRYSYVQNCPIRLSDPNGAQAFNSDTGTSATLHTNYAFNADAARKLLYMPVAQLGMVREHPKDHPSTPTHDPAVIPESVKRDYTASMASVHVTPKASVEKYTPQTPLGHATQAYAQVKSGNYGAALESLAGGAAQIVTAPITAPFKAIGSAITAGPDIYAAYQLGGTTAALESYASHFPVLGSGLAAAKAFDTKTTTTEETYAKWGDVAGHGVQTATDLATVVAGFGEAVPEKTGGVPVGRLPGWTKERVPSGPTANLLTWKQAVKAVKSPGRYNVVVENLADATKLVKEAIPGAVELPEATADAPYPKAGPGVKTWYQVQPAEPWVGNTLPHIKYADWSGGSKTMGGTFGHIFFKTR